MEDENKKTEDIEESFEEVSKTCEACGGFLKAEKVNLEEFEDGKLYLMENVLAYICQECGEMWVPEPTLQEFEKMMDTAKHHHEEQAPKRKIKPKVSRKIKERKE